MTSEADILHQPIETLDLGTAITNGLRRSNCTTVELLVACTRADIESMRQFGLKSRRTIEIALARHGLALAAGPDLSVSVAPPKPTATSMSKSSPRVNIKLTEAQVWDLQQLLRALCGCAVGGTHGPDVNAALLHAILDALDDAA